MSAMSSLRRQLSREAVQKAEAKDPSQAEFFKKEMLRMAIRQWVRENAESGLVARDED